jgi:hypothetical protein
MKRQFFMLALSFGAALSLSPIENTAAQGQQSTQALTAQSANSGAAPQGAKPEGDSKTYGPAETTHPEETNRLSASIANQCQKRLGEQSKLACDCYARNMKTAITIEDLRVIAAYWAGRLSGGDFVDRYDVLPNFETDIMVSCEEDRNYTYDNTHAFPGPDEQTFEQQAARCKKNQNIVPYFRSR